MHRREETKNLPQPVIPSGLAVPSVMPLSGESREEDSKHEIIDEPILISVFTQKGGVGKTTSTFNIAAILAKSYEMKVLMVDADPQCNLTGISLKQELLHKSGQSSLASYGKGKSKSKDLIKKKLRPVTTRGEGDCAFHAFGEKKGPEYFLESVHQRRNEVKNAIMERIKKKEEKQLRELVKGGIKELVMTNRSQVGQAIEQIIEAYLEFGEQKDISAPHHWAKFEEKLKQYPDIVECINKLSEGRECKNFHDQYVTAFYEEEWELEGRIMSIPSLYQAFKEYNTQTHLEFPWDDYINLQVIREYADYIGKPNEWLLPHELGIIAIIFKKTVEVYSDLKAAPDVYNEGKGEGEPIRVLFDAAARHFERLEEGPPQLALDDELILSDQLDEFYKEDEFFSQPYGESPGSKEKLERLAKKDKSEINNLYKAFSVISASSLLKQGIESVCKDVAERTVLQKLELLDSRKNLLLLPSSMDLYIIDNTLTSILCDPGAGATKSTSLTFMGVEYIRSLAKHNGCRVVFIDLSPNIGGLNQSLFLFSDYFIMPGTPSFFTNQALASLARALPKWIGTYSAIEAEEKEKRRLAKLLMVYIQKVKVVSDAYTSAPQNWIGKIENTLKNKLVPVLQEIRKGEMLIPGVIFDKLPTISLITDASLDRAESFGLPIALFNTYGDIFLNKQQASKHQEEFNELVKRAFSILARTDNRLEDFQKKFLSTTDEINQKVEKFIGTARNADFLRLIQEEFKQKPEIGSDNIYPQSVTSILVIIYAMKKELKPKFHLTYPYSYPQKSELSNFEKEIKHDLNLMIRNEELLYFIFCFYSSEKWIIMKIDLWLKREKRKKVIKGIQEIKFFCGENTLPQENEIAASLVQFFYEKIKGSDKENKLERRQADQLIEIKKGRHPIDIIRYIMTGKSANTLTFFKKHLGKANQLKPSQAELEQFARSYMPLHQKYIAHLEMNIRGLQKHETRELDQQLLDLLMKVNPQWIHQDFSHLTQIVFLHALLKINLQEHEEKEVKGRHEKEKVENKTKKELQKEQKKLKKEQRELKKARREQKKKAVAFLTLLFDRAFSKPENKRSVPEVSPAPPDASKVRKISGNITHDRQLQNLPSVSPLISLSVTTAKRSGNNREPDSSAAQFSRR